MDKAQRNIVTNKKSMNIKDTFHNVKDWGYFQTLH